MEPNYCPECGAELVADANVPNRWECPRCHKELRRIEVSDTTGCQEALGLHGASSETRDGLPVREMARHVSEEGHSSGTDVDRGQGGQSRVQRTMQPSAPAPRDPAGERKRADERAAVRALLPAYNRLHGTAYDTVTSGDDGRGDDVVASSPADRDPPRRFQVTFADTEGRLRASISRGQAYAGAGSEDDLLARFAEALRAKARAPDREAVLVLDGGGIVTPPGTVERFVQEYRRDLEAAPFGEVWWVDHAPGGTVRRL